MSTFTIIVLTALVVGFLYRVLKLYELIKSTLHWFILTEGMTPKNQFRRSEFGRLCLICFPCVCFFFITPIYLLFKVEWWIPIVAFFAGITLGNLIGFLFERLCQLPNHQTIEHSSFNLNAVELTMDDGRLYRRAVFLMILFSAVSRIISLIIIFRV